ncbi:hypothetical protein MIND_00513900 [Mycena indigotica]|uniref:ZZ-type domain-containing protein n=1 Tax=Mycena indigotica TaxID=2126181 RepID=A0A8H6WA12_9AGAR|nr:uncharacterized protein MIND_00513900 [Mycena indigotica]KAF7307203.1 hypothetical protein MIND_00513900 [Mycena indigotica]
MFTVKATYGRSGETRKFLYKDFPSYDQLYSNLYRVFPIPQGAALSKLLFSPDSSKTGTVLIAREIRNQDQYTSCTAAYAANSTGLLRFTVVEAEVTVEPTFIPMSHIPPPPIILSATPGMPGPSMAQLHQHTEPQSVTAGKACCDINEAKIQMQDMVAKLKDDLDRVLQSPALTPAPSAHIPLMSPPPPPSSFCLFKYCTTCAKIFQGPWYSCGKCTVVICPGCHANETGPQFCVAAMGPHILTKEVCAACPRPKSTDLDAAIPPWPQFYPPPPPPPPMWTPPSQTYSPVYTFGTATPRPNNVTPAVPPATTAPVPAPVIHRGVVCDICDKVIEGIRHKCLDCPDYDLCTSCIDSGSAERHNPFHEFLEIKEPGRVIVHNVYSGVGELDATPSTNARAMPQAEPHVEPVVHYATCNLCDSRIRGDRYKCQDCPDWDSCSACFTIVREQHPNHAFVKLANVSDLIRLNRRSPPVHMATCNGCSKTIYGIRYKCLHPTCPDTDFCEDCEALPIPVHPDNHPLLKMRSPSTVIPTVYKVGQTTTIDRAEAQAPIPPPKPINLTSSTFGHGFMMNPNARSNTMPASFFDSPSESSRSVSPIGMDYHPRPISPPFIPPPMMPGGLYEETGFARQPQPIFATRPYHHPTAVSRFSHSPSPPPSPPLFEPVQQCLSPVAQPALPSWVVDSSESYRRSLQIEEDLARQRREAVEQLVQAHKSLEQRVEEQQMRWTAPAVAEPAFWPKSSDELRHLMRSEYEPPSIAFSNLSVQEEPAVMDSPLTGDVMLNVGRVEEAEQANKSSGPVTFTTHSLAALLNGYESESEVEKIQESAVIERTTIPGPEPVAVPSLGLRATFQDDITLPDGQIFPPGAEFMKCWRMVNSGGEEWPASTELVWVAGERLARGPGIPASVPIGVVKVGAEIDLWTGELKAPEVPGRYVSYWRLRNEEGMLFGDNIWIDITVEETRSNESSLSSSSIIVMPRGAQSIPTSSVNVPDAQSGSSASHVEVEEDDDDSDSSESDVSLISMPVSDDEDWADVPAGEAPQRYVVLYDDTSATSHSGSDEE